MDPFCPLRKMFLKSAFQRAKEQRIIRNNIIERQEEQQQEQDDEPIPPIQSYRKNMYNNLSND
jgi:hypothetical protein